MCERLCCWAPHMRHERDLSSAGGKCGAGSWQLEAAAAGLATSSEHTATTTNILQV